METLPPENTPKSFQVASPPRRENLDDQITNEITRDDREYVRYQLNRLPRAKRQATFEQYLLIYAQAYRECANINGRDNAGRYAANTWLRTDAQAGKPAPHREADNDLYRESIDEAREERAAIIEYDGGLSREQAEQLASAIHLSDKSQA